MLKFSKKYFKKKPMKENKKYFGIFKIIYIMEILELINYLTNMC
jgi:hypothetical protein